jgi:hypothetical protein
VLTIKPWLLASSPQAFECGTSSVEDSLFFIPATVTTHIHILEVPNLFLPDLLEFKRLVCSQRTLAVATQRDGPQLDPLDGGRPGSETFSRRGVVVVVMKPRFGIRLPSGNGEVFSRSRLRLNMKM